jgi:hypothetical protein
MTENKIDTKPGWKTTEFWLTALADIFGALMISGIFAEGSMWARIVGGGIMVLATLGYSAARSKSKTGA